jgi:hypothetical protein
MADTPEDWEHAEDDEPILDLDLDQYNQFLLDNPKLGEDPLEEEAPESKEQPKCYMNLQDPEPPREALESLRLKAQNASYETSDEARLCLLRLNDNLEAENNHLRQQLSQSPDTQQI